MLAVTCTWCCSTARCCSRTRRPPSSPPPPLCRRRRHQQGRGRRRRPGRDRSVQGDGRGRAGAARGSRRQVRRARMVRAALTTTLRADSSATRIVTAAFRKAEVTIKETPSIHRTHPSLWKPASALAVRQDQGPVDDPAPSSSACDPHRGGADRQHPESRSCDRAGMCGFGNKAAPIPAIPRGGLDRHRQAGDG